MSLALAAILGPAPMAPAAPAFPTGHVQEYQVRSRHQGRERRVWVYTRPGYDAPSDTSLGMVLAFDAREYLDEIPVPHTLDSLLADTGPLRMARYLEPFTLLVARLAYQGDGGPELAYRFEWRRR